MIRMEQSQRYKDKVAHAQSTGFAVGDTVENRNHAFSGVVVAVCYGGESEPHGLAGQQCCTVRAADGKTTRYWSSGLTLVSKGVPRATPETSEER